MKLNSDTEHVNLHLSIQLLSKITQPILLVLKLSR